MLCFVNGLSQQALTELDLQKAFDALNLKPYLSQSRGNGLNAMINRINAIITP